MDGGKGMASRLERSGWSAARVRAVAWGGAAALILLPLVAMRFTSEVDWDAADFLLAIGLFGGVGLMFELAVRMSPSRSYRAGVAVALAAAFLLTWINLAVGIIGNEENPFNLLYFAVIAVAALGAVAARFRAGGMAVAMAVAAGGQVLVAVIALAGGFGFTGPITVFFGGLWLAAAWLFRKAAREAA
jgi:hypothetical protein